MLSNPSSPVVSKILIAMSDYHWDEVEWINYSKFIDEWFEFYEITVIILDIDMPCPAQPVDIIYTIYTGLLIL